MDTAIAILRTDPWSADLTYGIAGTYYQRKDEAETMKYAARFVQIAPNSKFIQRAP